MRWATLLFALGACLLPDAAAATETTDESEYFLRVWRTDDGLPPLVTPTLIESPEGYLWMESAAGLVRFDGERFVTFDASAIGWPAGTRAARTFADGRQGLWVVLSDASVWRERGGKWAQWVVLPKGESAHIIHPIRDSDGGVHIGTSRGRLLRCTDTAPGFLEVMAVAGFGRWLEWPGADGSVWFTKGNDPHRWLAGRIERAPLAEPDIRNPYYYSWKDGTMWIIGADCVAKWNGLAFQKLPPIPRLAPQEVAGILPAPPHGVWATTVNRIFFLPTGAKEWKVAGPWGTHAEQRQRMNLSDSRGHKWIATYGFGFLRVTPDGKHIPVRLPPELAANRILNLIEDRERNIWGVAEGSGLVRLRQRHFIVHRADKALSDPEVLAIAEDAGGAIWAGSRAGGVDVYSEGVWQHRALPPGDEPAAGATSILAAPDGSVWAGTVARGVWRSEGDTWKMLGDGKESARVLFADTAGTVWMGGPKGLFQWLANQWKAAPATGTISTARALAEDSSGRVWVATENGVWRGDKSGPFSPVPESEGLPSESSYAISIEPDGTVWIGFESGLAQWRDGHAALYRPDDGLPVRKILGIFPGGGSHLWVSSPDGLAALDRTRLTMKKGEPISGRLFTRADGLPTREASGGFQPAALRSRDGHCWLPTHQGLVEFDSEEIPPPALPPPVVIEEAFAMRQNTRLPLEVPPLRASAVPIELAPGMRRLEFRFTAPSLSAPEKVHFRWRMDGLDNEWSEPLPRRNATYPYVPSGRYAFESSPAMGTASGMKPGSPCRLLSRRFGTSGPSSGWQLPWDSPPFVSLSCVNATAARLSACNFSRRSITNAPASPRISMTISARP